MRIKKKASTAIRCWAVFQERLILDASNRLTNLPRLASALDQFQSRRGREIRVPQELDRSEKRSNNNPVSTSIYQRRCALRTNRHFALDVNPLDAPPRRTFAPDCTQSRYVGYSTQRRTVSRRIRFKSCEQTFDGIHLGLHKMCFTRWGVGVRLRVVEASHGLFQMSCGSPTSCGGNSCDALAAAVYQGFYSLF